MPCTEASLNYASMSYYTSLKFAMFTDLKFCNVKLFQAYYYALIQLQVSCLDVLWVMSRDIRDTLWIWSYAEDKRTIPYNASFARWVTRWSWLSFFGYFKLLTFLINVYFAFSDEPISHYRGELARKHFAEAFWNAEVVWLVDINVTFTHMSSREDFMDMIGKKRASNPYPHRHCSEECQSEVRLIHDYACISY